MRVVVTGLGLVTPVGIGWRQVWEALLAGRSGIGPVQSFDTAAFPVHRGAEVEGFRGDEQPPVGRASRFALVAAELALRDAGFADLDAARSGVVMGTTSGEPLEVERFDDRYVAGELEAVGAEFITLYPCHVIAQHVAAHFGLAGLNAVLPTACAAGNYAIAYAADILRAGRADLMLAGGADAFSRITYSGFARLGAIAPERCQPFDRNRKGMIPGEGAAVLVLEPLECARARGRRAYAEVAGCGLSCDAHHMTAVHPDGPARAMRQALRGSDLEPRDVSYISAHGTGTATNDRMETEAVKQVFGAAAHDVPISSIKSMLGHTMGAASAIEGAVCALAVSEDHVPPTMGYEEPDPDCDLDYVPNRARPMRVDVAMNNAYAFGGNNASVIFRKVVE